MANKKKQIVITISREYGSLGQKIAEHVGEQLDIPVITKELLYMRAEEDGYNKAFIKKYDEKARNMFTSRKRKGLTNSIEDNFANLIFQYQRDLVETGGSFIFVGRCAETTLKDHPNLIRILVTADFDQRVEHCSKSEKLELKEARAKVKKMDKRRANYHNYYSDSTWNSVDGYDLIISSSELGVEGCVDLIKKYVALWKKKSPNWDEE